jgi:xanthine dehydrogenase accessory factor
MLDELYTAIAHALRAGEQVALVTIVRVEGSTPRSPGAQMLVWSNGRTMGTIGGGALEARIVKDALTALATGHSHLEEYSLRGNEPEGLGVCGGCVQVFTHVLRPGARLVIAGAGHVAQPLAQLAAQVGFRVLVVDDRPEFLSAERFPAAETQVVTFGDLHSQVHLDEHTSVVIVTRSHEHDEVVLRQMLDLPLAYLGLMGSRGKVHQLFNSLREEGFGHAQLERVHAPIGLDIRAETPTELAVSILAEVIGTGRGGSGLPLSRVTRASDAAAGVEGDFAEGLVVVRGAGDLATGVAHRLHRAGLAMVMTEIAQPRALRRAVSFAIAVFEGQATVEGVTAVRVESADEAREALARRQIALLVDPEARIARTLAPEVLVDAIVAKRNVGTRITDAPLVVGLGPGFTAGADVHVVVETMRGHDLGRMITEGSAEPNTGLPGPIMGHARERVLWSPADGTIQGRYRIGQRIEAGDTVAEVAGLPVVASVSGVLRGLLHDGLPVQAGEKVGDVDPRGIVEHCFTISDKARAIAGGVLEAILHARQQRALG